MKDKKINSPLILVSPMDWGLGHATRCIPIITGLLAQNCRVMIAASGAGLVLLNKEFPQLTCLDIGGYNIRYSRKKAWMPFILIGQFPKILSVILKEHRWLKKAIGQYAIDAVISDNRMGLFSHRVPCIYITHQLQIKTGYSIPDRFARNLHYRFINRYHECWIPDQEKENDLSGELSHPGILPGIPVRYIGPLSRFRYSIAEKKYDLAIILSGPEPQRSVLEELLLKDIDHVNGKIILIRGLPDSSASGREFPSRVEVHDHLDSDVMNNVILQSGLIISRCGYSTVMDLAALRKKAILIPTPGQTEQEYLARYLSEKKLFCCIGQEGFSLSGALKKSAGFSYSSFEGETTLYQQEIGRLVDSLRINSQQ